MQFVQSCQQIFSMIVVQKAMQRRQNDSLVMLFWSEKLQNLKFSSR